MLNMVRDLYQFKWICGMTNIFRVDMVGEHSNMVRGLRHIGWDLTVGWSCQLAVVW